MSIENTNNHGSEMNEVNECPNKPLDPQANETEATEVDNPKTTPSESKKTEDTKTEKRTRDEVTIKRQILTNVRKYLANQADEKFKKTGEYKAPTPEEIKAECTKRWQSHIDRKKEKEDVSAFFD